MFSRLNRTPILKMGSQYGTCEAITVIRQAIKNGRLSTREFVVHEAQRLDVLAGSIYGDGRSWWVLAASSNVGWGCQVPPGTIILVPDINAVADLVA